VKELREAGKLIAAAVLATQYGHTAITMDTARSIVEEVIALRAAIREVEWSDEGKSPQAAELVDTGDPVKVTPPLIGMSTMQPVIGDHKSTRERLEYVRGEYHKLYDECVKLKASNDKLKARLHDADEAIEAYKERVEQMTQERDTARERVGTLLAKTDGEDGLVARLDRYAEDRDAYERTLKKVRDEAANAACAATETINSLQNRVDDLTEERNGLKKRLRNTYTYSERIEKLEAQLAEVTDERDELKYRLTSLEK